MEVHSSGYHRLEAVAASSDRARKRAVTLYLPLVLAIVASLVLHSATLGAVLLAPRAAAEVRPPASDIDVDLFETSDIDVRPSGVDTPAPGAPPAQAPPAAPPAEPPAETHTDIAIDRPDDPEPVPSAIPAPPPKSPPSASAPPPRPPPTSTVPPSPTPTAPSSTAPPASATPTAPPPSTGSGTGAGSSTAPPGPPPGFSANTPPAAARLVFHVVRENAEGKDWATLVAGSRAELRAVLAIDAAGKATCTPDEGSPAHLVRALTNACFRLRAEKVALDVDRYGPGRVRVRIVASISDVPVPEDRPDGIFGLKQRFAEGKGYGEFTQTNGRRVEILIEVEQIDATP